MKSILKLQLAIAALSMSGTSMAAGPGYALDSLISSDGTTIGYRRYGQGPGLVLVQGAMGTAENYHELASLLSTDFTVYVADRRGRGMSPSAYSEQHNIAKDVADLTGLLEKTGAHFVFGLSSGAIITLETARTSTAITKAAVYEPPFYLDGVPIKKIDQVKEEIEKGKLAAAMATVFKIVKVGPKLFNIVPRPLLVGMTGAFLKSEEKNNKGRYTPFKELIPTMRFDFNDVRDRGDSIHLFHTVQQPVLLLGGSRSPRYLKKALTKLEQVLPHNRRINFKKLNHSGPWNHDIDGSPSAVALALKNFFLEKENSK